MPGSNISLFTATLPKTLAAATGSLIPNALSLMTESLHKPPAGVHHEFLRLNQSTTKLNLLVETLKKVKITGNTNRVLVFCNTGLTAEAVYKDLAEKKFPVILVAASRENEQLDKDMREFRDKETDTFMIAICTDMASRGIDTTVVGQVINYDFPFNVIDCKL